MLDGTGGLGRGWGQMSSRPTGTLARDVVDPPDTSVNSGAGTPPSPRAPPGVTVPFWGPPCSVTDT